jgi:hypothetical protein
VARTQPAEALNLASELPPGARRDELLAHGARQWAAQTPQEAIVWAEQLPDEVVRGRLFASIASVWADSDPLAAATFAATSIKPGRPQEDAVVSVIQQWAQQAPEAAAAWIQEFPTGALRETALEELVKLWAGTDSTRAGEWINQLAGPDRDLAISTYATKIAPQFPDAALVWAGSIQDDVRREREITKLVELWLASDASAARKWIAESTFPAALKERLLAAPPQ